jgi:hypothetical protein
VAVVKAHDLLTAVQGGHNIAGNGVCDRGS